MTDKGFDLEGLVRCLVAMKRSGLLVHAYLIYGFPGQARSDIVDSAEVCRQLFAAGLVDSAFWHRFVLTRHSRMYTEWRLGKRPDLEPVDRLWDFANNDLAFEGESAFDEFDGPLSATLEAWMSGESLKRPAVRSLAEAGLREPFRPGARGGSPVAPDLVESLISKAESRLDEEKSKPPKGCAHWIAGRPVVGVGSGSEGAVRLAWAYRGEMESIEAALEDKSRIAKAIDLASRPEGCRAEEFLETAGLSAPALAALRQAGLVFI
jgi:hypothetical protein